MFFVFDSLQCQRTIADESTDWVFVPDVIHFVNCLYIGQKDEQLVFDCSLGLIVSCVNLL